MSQLTNNDLGKTIAKNTKTIKELQDRISRLEKFVLLAIVTNLPQLLKIFQA